MSTNYQLPTTNSKRGAALLMAVVISSVMLSVGLGVYQRTYKQLVFASFWKQMQVAFAAADSGLECAMYWDLHPTASATCFGPVQTVSVSANSTWDPTAASPYNEGFTVPASGGCVKVTITKPSPHFRADGVTPYSTFIESRGYNDACGSTNPRRVERGLHINY